MSENASFFDAAGYDMVKLLGKGSVAKVWLVRDRQFGHVRALKVLDNAVGEDQASSDSFFRECALLLRIGNSGHPNIVWIGRPRVVMDRAMVEMQYVPGRTLTDFIHTDSPFVPYEEILRFIGDIGSALALLHTECYKSMMMPGDDRKMSQEELIARYGISHNDLHTSNIMRRSADGAYILLDFGLAFQFQVIQGEIEPVHPQRLEPQVLVAQRRIVLLAADGQGTRRIQHGIHAEAEGDAVLPAFADDSLPCLFLFLAERNPPPVRSRQLFQGRDVPVMLSEERHIAGREKIHSEFFQDRNLSETLLRRPVISLYAAYLEALFPGGTGCRQHRGTEANRFYPMIHHAGR